MSTSEKKEGCRERKRKREGRGKRGDRKEGGKFSNVKIIKVLIFHDENGLSSFLRNKCFKYNVNLKIPNKGFFKGIELFEPEKIL